jgi:hypothetical protein
LCTLLAHPPVSLSLSLATFSHLALRARATLCQALQQMRSPHCHSTFPLRFRSWPFCNTTHQIESPITQLHGAEKPFLLLLSEHALAVWRAWMAVRRRVLSLGTRLLRAARARWPVVGLRSQGQLTLGGSCSAADDTDCLASIRQAARAGRAARHRRRSDVKMNCVMEG